ncbi:hypothetical protein [Micromonospora cremea]|uniref:hypothetical protein n=1 Tax=Micromonospora cremea TaxID=709881 RepID=UPI000A03941F
MGTSGQPTSCPSRPSPQRSCHDRPARPRHRHHPAPRPEDVVRAGRELAEAGLDSIEVTLTTPTALEAIAELRNAVAGTCAVGAGSVRTPGDVSAARDAGA